MRRYSFYIAFLVMFVPGMVISCSKVPLNEADGSYFYHENTRVVFEDKGYMLKDDNGNLSIACFNGPEVIGKRRDCINILVPKGSFTLNDNRLSFRNSFNAKARFFTKLYEHGGHALVSIHLIQSVRVHVSGAIINDTGQDFFQTGNAYPCSVSLSFSLEDGSNIRLQMNSMTVSDETTLIIWPREFE